MGAVYHPVTNKILILFSMLVSITITRAFAQEEQKCIINIQIPQRWQFIKNEGDETVRKFIDKTGQRQCTLQIFIIDPPLSIEEMMRYDQHILDLAFSKTNIQMHKCTFSNVNSWHTFEILEGQQSHFVGIASFVKNNYLVTFIVENDLERSLLEEDSQLFIKNITCVPK